MKDTPVSKILVLDDNPLQASLIKHFCDENHLIPLKVRKGAVMSVLSTNIDLGGILYSENYEDSPADTAQLAREIHAARPELPIIIRRELQATLQDLPDDSQHVYCAAYVAGDMGALRKVIDEYISAICIRMLCCVASPSSQIQCWRASSRGSKYRWIHPISFTIA